MTARTSSPRKRTQSAFELPENVIPLDSYRKRRQTPPERPENRVSDIHITITESGEIVFPSPVIEPKHAFSLLMISIALNQRLLNIYREYAR